jgi:capsid portal protein
MALLDFLFTKQKTETPQPKEAQPTYVVSVNLQNSDFPKIREIKNKEWVNFGDDNLYPDTLIDLYNSSSIHQSILTQKSKMIAGNGYTYDDTTLTDIEKVELQKLLKYFDNDKSIDTFLDLVSGDWELFGSMCVEIIWSRDFSKVVQFKRVKPSYIRSGKMKEGKVEEYYYSTDWSNIRSVPPVRIAAFNINDKENYTQLLYIKKYNPNTEYYGVPTYTSALNWIAADSQIAVFHNNNIRNGFNPGQAYHFTKKPNSIEEREIIVNELKRQYSGARNSGKPLVFFSDGVDNKTIIETISPSDLDKQFTVIHEQIVTQICSSHRVTSTELFGIAVPGRLGNADINTAYNIFENTVINPERRVIETLMNDLFFLNGLSVNFKLKPLNILVV